MILQYFTWRNLQWRVVLIWLWRQIAAALTKSQRGGVAHESGVRDDRGWVGWWVCAPTELTTRHETIGSMVYI